MRIAKTGPLIRTFGKSVQSTGLNSNRKFSSLTKDTTRTPKGILGANKFNPLWNARSDHNGRFRYLSSAKDEGDFYEEVVKSKVVEISAILREVTDITYKDAVEKNEIYEKHGSSVEDYSDCDPEKFEKIYPYYEPQMSQYKNWNKDVDRALCSRGTLLFRKDPQSDRASFMNVISGRSKKLLPITYLPSKIIWGNGDVITYPEGLIKDEVGIKRFEQGYGASVGEGSHFHASTYVDLLLIVAQAFSDSQKREFDSVLVAVTDNSKAYKLFKSLGLKDAENENQVNLCEYLEGDIEVPVFAACGKPIQGEVLQEDGSTKIDDLKVMLNVPQVQKKDGGNLVWKYISISSMGILRISETHFKYMSPFSKWSRR